MIITFIPALLFLGILGCNYSRNFDETNSNLTTVETNIPVQDSLIHPIEVIRNDKPNGMNIEPTYIKFINMNTRQELKTINVSADNPFSKSGLKVINNETPLQFFYYKPPGRGLKSDFNKLFGPKMFDKIPDDVKFERILFRYEIDEVQSNYISISYKLNLDTDYFERKGTAYQVSYIEVYDNLGNQIYSKMVDGGIHGKVVLSKDGKYVTYFNVIDQYNKVNIRTEFNIYNIRDDVKVYGEIYDNLFLDRCYSYSETAENITYSVVTQPGEGDIFCFYPDENRLYKTTNKIEGLYTCFGVNKKDIIIGFKKKPNDTLNLDKEFSLIF